jgi:tRNA (cmo5U34)-methyltransferase
MLAVLPHWQEDHSRTFLDYGNYFVPQREEQIQVVLDLMAPLPSSSLVVELCSGSGILSRAILERFEKSEVLALDGSEEMRRKTIETCRAAGCRLEVAAFDLAEIEWRHFKRRPHAVVSSLSVHHLDSQEKRVLYRDMADALADGGVLIIADIVRPPSNQGLVIAARQWDDAVQTRSRQIDGNLAAFTEFQRLNWNYFRDPDGQPIDKPSSLAEQLEWFREAGLRKVDCAWMTAGHAIFYGYK